MFSRPRAPAATPSRSAGFPHWRLERLVVTAPVDLRYFRSHGAQIRGQLAAVVDAVIVEELEIEGRRQIEDTEEIDRRTQLSRGEGTHPLRRGVPMAVRPWCL